MQSQTFMDPSRLRGTSDSLHVCRSILASLSLKASFLAAFQTAFSVTNYVTDSRRHFDWVTYYLDPFCRVLPFDPTPNWVVFSSKDPESFSQIKHSLGFLSSRHNISHDSEPVQEFDLKGARVVSFLHQPWLIFRDFERNHFAFFSPASDGESIQEPSRVIRELFSRDLENRGFCLFHSGAVAWGQRGVLIPGRSGSGKTTAVLSLVEHAEASFMTNDCTYVGLYEDSVDLELVAWPEAARVGLGTLHASAKLRKWLNKETMFRYEQEPLDHERLSTLTQRELWSETRDVELTPRELAQTFGSGLAVRAHLKAIVFPRISQESITSEVSIPRREWIYTVLTGESLTPIDPHYPDWLGLRKRTESDLRDLSKRVSGQIADSIPSWRVKFGDGRSLAQEVLRFLPGDQAVP